MAAPSTYLFERMVRAFLACPVPLHRRDQRRRLSPAGCESALCCDFAYAAETARFALTEVTLGIMPGAGGTQNLPRAIGERRAKEMILTGTPVHARRMRWPGAWSTGCARRPSCCDGGAGDGDDASPTTRRSRCGRPSTRSITGLQMDLASGMMFEIEAYYRMVPTEDRLEGIRPSTRSASLISRGADVPGGPGQPHPVPAARETGW